MIARIDPAELTVEQKKSLGFIVRAQRPAMLVLTIARSLDALYGRERRKPIDESDINNLSHLIMAYGGELLVQLCHPKGGERLCDDPHFCQYLSGVGHHHQDTFQKLRDTCNPLTKILRVARNKATFHFDPVLAKQATKLADKYSKNNQVIDFYGSADKSMHKGNSYSKYSQDVMHDFLSDGGRIPDEVLCGAVALAIDAAELINELARAVAKGEGLMNEVGPGLDQI